MMHSNCMKFRVLLLLFLGNGLSSILAFEMISKARKPHLVHSTSQRQRLVAAFSKPQGLLRCETLLSGHDVNPSSPERSEQETFSTYDNFSTPRNLERMENPHEEIFQLTSAYSIPNILEYKDNRDPMDDASKTEKKAFFEDIKALKRKITSADKAYSFAIQKNKPKKKNVSIHSSISSLSVMAALVVLLPTFHPGFDDLRMPQLFNYEYASADLLWQAQLVALLQMVSSILGIFRLPKRSPSVRTAGFVISALAITQLSLVVMSSLNGTDVYLFDAFSIQGRVLISVINTALIIKSFDSLAIIIGDKDKKGWDSVPGYSSRLAAFITVFPFHVLICITGNAVLPVLSDKESFLENALPFFDIFPGVQTLGYVATSLAVGLAALLATLQFERKITDEVASFLNIAVILFFTYDSIKFMYLLAAVPDRFAHSEYFVSYTPHLQSLWHTNEALVLGTVLALMIGLRDLSRAKILSATARANLRKAAAKSGQAEGAPPLAAETVAPSTTTDTMSSATSVVLPSSPVSLEDNSSKLDQDILDVEERDYQVVIDLERIVKNSKSVEQDDATN